MDQRKRPIEREFGVPIPGEILPPEQWARTALKKLPPTGQLDLEQLFGRRAPLILDLGCGNGRYLLGSALTRPDHDHLGSDVLPMVIRYATRRGNQRGLHNLRFAVCDAERFLRDYIAPTSVAEIHCYHPQPYHDPEKRHRRLFTDTFLELVAQSLVPGGWFCTQTDSRDYWEQMLALLPRWLDFEEVAGRWPDAPKGRTRREIMALRRGLTIWRGQGRKRMDGNAS